LESAGLIVRQRSRQDERQVAVTLTETGRALHEKALAIPESVRCAAACDTDSLAALQHELETLRHQLHKA
ncbi:MAG TPA: MarR family transcriptional regulator, partial [Escherichia sp.]|nr:MarR family transcriptional regulator [Escherichia sp.]